MQQRRSLHLVAVPQHPATTVVAIYTATVRTTSSSSQRICSPHFPVCFEIPHFSELPPPLYRCSSVAVLPLCRLFELQASSPCFCFSLLFLPCLRLCFC
ncbi:uncharacterized protein DS421_16g546780 [Arachis hypogaea]|nr:uncharacterized protein DS421_16g546780 [Arachis hypogaea]